MSEPKELLMPPANLMKEWYDECRASEKPLHWPLFSVLKAAQWGADQQLEACCDWVEKNDMLKRAHHDLRAHCRPKPPSLKQQALQALETADIGYSVTLTPAEGSMVRRALEALPDE